MRINEAEQEPLIGDVKFHRAAHCTCFRKLLRELNEQQKMLAKVFRALSTPASMARFWLVVLIIYASAIAEVFLYYYTLVEGGKLLYFFANDDEARYNETAINFAYFLVPYTVLNMFHTLEEQYLTLLMRKSLTDRAHDVYLENFYFFTLHRDAIDNPDQRIVEDAQTFANLSQPFFGPFARGIVNFLFGIVILYNSVLGGWEVCLALLLLSLLLTIVTSSIQSHIARYAVTADKMHGNFRFLHSSLREFSEPITLYGAQEVHSQAAQYSLGALVKAYYSFYWRQAATVMLGFFSNGYLLALASVLWHLFYKDPEKFATLPAEQLTTAYIVFSNLSAQVTQFSALITDPTKFDLAGCAGAAKRVLQLISAVGHADRGAFGVYSQEQLTGTMHDIAELAEHDAILSCSNVTVIIPNGEILAQSLSFQLKTAQSLLIMGPSGCGKTSIVRTIAGLTPHLCGAIHRPSAIGTGGIFFLPQRPYVNEGCLRDLVIYPRSVATIKSGQECDRRIVECFKKARLNSLLGRYNLDVQLNWSDILSGGELQRLAFARLFFHQPLLAVLDESTSALDEENERAIYEQLQRDGIGFVSVSHRLHLKRFHTFVLTNEGDDWTLVASVSEEDDEQQRPPAIGGVPFPSAGQARLLSSACSSLLSLPSSPDSAKSLITPPPFFISSSMLHTEALAAAVPPTNNPLHFCARVWLVLRAVRLTFSWYSVITTMLFCGFAMVTFVVMAPTTAEIGATILRLVTRPERVNQQNVFDKRALVDNGVALSFYYFGYSASYANEIFFSFLWILSGFYAVVKRLHALYFRHCNFYRLNTQTDLDNPDQRMVEDTLELSTLFQTMVSNLLLTIIVIVSSATAFHFPAQPVFELGAPLLLIYLIAFPIMQVFKYRLFFAKDVLEGNFRWNHVRVRVHAEAISFYGARDVEIRKIRESFDNVVANQLQIVWLLGLWDCLVKLLSGFAEAATRLIGGFAIYWFPSSASLSSIASLGRTEYYQIGVNVAMFLFAALANIFSGFIDLGKLFSNGARTSELYRTLLRIDSEQEQEERKYTRNVQLQLSDVEHSQLNSGTLDDAPSLNDLNATRSRTYRSSVDENAVLQLIDVDIAVAQSLKGDKNFADIQDFTNGPEIASGQRILLSKLSFRLRRGQRLLIEGASGTGKSSIARVIAGLWPMTSGLLIRPGHFGRGGIFFLSQQPFLCNADRGTLKEEIQYPAHSSEEQAADSVFENLLSQVGLQSLLNRVGGVCVPFALGNTLSLGEQQRLCIARLLFHQPLVCVLDEHTSALDNEIQQQLLELLSKQNFAMVSIGHRSAELKKFHDFLLTVEGDGRWDLSKIWN